MNNLLERLVSCYNYTFKVFFANSVGQHFSTATSHTSGLIEKMIQQWLQTQCVYFTYMNKAFIYQSVLLPKPNHHPSKWSLLIEVIRHKYVASEQNSVSDDITVCKGLYNLGDNVI